MLTITTSHECTHNFVFACLTRGSLSLLVTGTYRYLEDLRELQSHHSPYTVAQELNNVNSPMLPLVHKWEEYLSDHQDKEFGEYIIRGIREGFRIGFNWSAPLAPAKRNIPSSYSLPREVEEYISKELGQGNFVGPLPLEKLSNEQIVQVNRIGVIPKGHNKGKWKLITDLSFPPGMSVNDGVTPELCSLEYVTVDKVAALAMAQGRER